MRPNEVKPYSESYQHLWKIRESYQEFRFTIMNMMVDDAYDKTDLESKAKTPDQIIKEIDRPLKLKELWVPLETAQKLEERVKAGQHLEKMWREEIKELEKQIVEAKKILNEFSPEIALPIMGNPAIFRQESEYDKGDTEGFYRMRNEALQVLDGLIKRLSEALK